MSTSWRTVPLASLCESVDYGYTASAQALPVGPKFLRITDIRRQGIDWRKVPHVEIPERKLARYRLADGDVVIARTGAFTGHNALVKKPPAEAVFASYLVRLRPRREEVEPSFLYYYLQSEDYADHIAAVTGGSAQPNASATALVGARLALPPRETQRAIARLLGGLDDKIDLNWEMSHTLEETAQALFRSWFVDFDPVIAKADGRKPFGMNAEVAALFPASFKETQLGPIPKEWVVSTIGAEVEVVGGSTPSTADPEYWKPAEHCWATPRDLASLQEPVLLSTERQISTTGLQEISSGLLPRGTVLLSSRAPIGYLAIAEVPTAINQGFIAMRCNRRLGNLFVLRWAEASMDEITSRAGGTTFAEISKSSFRPILIAVPSEKIHAAWHEIAEPLHRMIVANAQESRTLAGLRDSLLPKLLSGEIRLRQAEEIVEVAL